MALPSAFLTALALDRVAGDVWVELEGLPWAYGLAGRDAAWFSGRAAAEARAGTAGVLLGLPRGAEQEARPLEADSSVGQLTVQLQLDAAGTVLPLIGNGARRDGQVASGAPERASLTSYGSGQVIRVQNTPAGGYNAYACTTPGITAASPPVVADDAATITDGSAGFTLIGAMDWDASVTPTGLAFTGTATDFPAAGVLYLGRETVAYVGKVQGTGSGFFAGLTRGQYALPGMEAKTLHTAGDLISPYPRFVATRRAAWYTTLDGTDTNRVTRWAGTVRGAKLMAGAAGLELVLESLEGDLKAKVFGNQRTGKLAVGLTEADGSYQSQDDTEPRPETDRLVLEEGSTAGTWTHGDEILVRLGDEYLAGTVAVDGTETAIALTGRGCLSSQAVQHSPGDDLVEVIYTGARDADRSAADRVSKFTAGDHPFDVALSFLCSRLGDGANGAYDVLPPGWGLGIDASRIDLAGIAAVKRTWFPGARHIWVYEEPFSLKTVLADMLRPHACYPVTTLGDLLTFRRLSPPIPGATLRDLDASAVVAVPSWDANIADVVGRVIWRCDFDPVTGKHRQTFTGELQGPGTEAQEFYAGLWKTLEVDAKGAFTGNDTGTPYFGSGLSTSATESAQRYFELVRDRYARPFPVIAVECSYDYLDVEVGDLVTLTVANIPDVTTGALGIAGAICEVLRKAIDDVRGVVALTLLHSTASSQFRLMSPSGKVAFGGSGVATLALVDGEYNDAGQDRTAGFYVGQVVEFWSSDLKTLRGSVTLTGVTATNLEMAASPAGTVAGDLAVLASYASQPAAEKLRHASLASAAELLGGADEPHVYAT